MSLTWRGDEIMARLRRQQAERAERALRHVVGVMKEVVSIPYPPASQPGEPPRMRSGDLLISIDYEWDAATLSGRVVATAPYATFLEFGTDKMAPRPFFTSTIDAEKPTMRNIIGGG